MAMPAINTKPLGTPVITIPDLRGWRLYKNMTGRELAIAAHVTESTISRIENHPEGIVRISTLRSLAVALMISLQELRGSAPHL